jgi:acyl carrier protein
MNATLEHVKALLAREYQLAPDRLTAGTSLDSLGIDSLAAVELLWRLEETLGIKLPSEPAMFDTLGDVAAFLDKLVARQGAGRGLANPLANRLDRPLA